MSQFTSLKVGGPAEWYAAPRTRTELLELLVDCRRLGVPYRLMGRGSNLLIPDEGVAGMVIRTVGLDRTVEINDRYVTVGAGVPLQRLISVAGQSNLGGIEYLFSVPGNIGGAIKMNAGRGAKWGMSVSNHLVRVEVFDGSSVRWLTREACRFEYRSSIFHEHPNWVILSALLELEVVPGAQVREAVRERMEYTRRHQDNKTPNAGSVFKRNYKLDQELRGARVGGASFSTLTGNWIVNLNGTSSDIRKLVDKAIRLHRKRGLPEPILEWDAW